MLTDKISSIEVACATPIVIVTNEFGLIRTATGKMVLYYMVGTPIMRYVPDEVLPLFCFNMKLLKDTRSFATKLILPSLSKEMTIFENGKDAAKDSEELDSGQSESPRIPTDVLIAARKLNHSTIILNVTPQEPKSFSLRNSVTYILKFIPPIPLSYLVKYTKDVMKYTRILPTPAKYAKAIPSTHVKAYLRFVVGSIISILTMKKTKSLLAIRPINSVYSYIFGPKPTPNESRLILKSAEVSDL